MSDIRVEVWGEIRSTQRPLNDDWRIKYTFGRTPLGALTVVRVEVHPNREDDRSPDEHGVTVAMLRQVTLAPIRRYLDLKSYARRPERTAPTRPRRRGSLTSRQYRKIWTRFRQLVCANDPAPSKTLAAELNANRNTVRTWIARAKVLYGGTASRTASRTRP